MGSENQNILESQLEQDEKRIVLATEVLPENLAVIPINDRPIFPGIVIPIIIENDTLKNAIETVYQSAHKTVGLFLTRGEEEEEKETYSLEDIFPVGVAAKILKLIPTETNELHVLISSQERVRLQDMVTQYPYPIGKVEYHHEAKFSMNEELKAYSMAVVSSIKELLKLNPLFKEELKIFLTRSTLEEPGKLADFAASLTTADREQLQDVLETFKIRERIDKVLLLLRKELDVTRLQAKITRQIEDKISKHQRTFFLKEQLRAIQKELGIIKDDRTAAVERYIKRLKKLKFSQEAMKVVNEELEKISLLEPASPEYHVSYNYLEWLTSLPWGKQSKDNYDQESAQKILDQDHYGLEDVKERILEFISVGKLRKNITGSILCLIGPPGVGKTSLGKSIARTLGRKFYRFSLGGMRDEAEIKGHRRTYIGAMPGKFIQSLKVVQTQNPVIMLDEIDKVGKSFQGDPASALLEVLDPEQNVEFLDHFLDVRFDLSNILFIATANQPDTIPAPLLDRMEILRLSGYVLEEKIEIAKRFLIPKQIKNHGLNRKKLVIQDDALKQMIDQYAREAGVRSLENQIKKICRKAARHFAGGARKAVTITPENLAQYLGMPVFSRDEINKERIPGLVTGLAWTETGGAILSIEAAGILSRRKGFKQTGQLGEVMIESSEIAYSYIMSSLARYQANPKYFDEHFVHLHVPAGATPKDGPSAGITMATALLSLVLQKPVSPEIAMTGEITLTGQVLPIGGLKEKIIASRRANIKELLFPWENKKDFDELPAYIKEGLTVHYVKRFDEVYQLLFQGDTCPEETNSLGNS
ncbi:MAG: endopeptidase La [bacterium]